MGVTRDGTADDGYVELAEDRLQEWALSEDEVGGDLWDLFCGLAGVDPETFADMVRFQRRKRAKEQSNAAI